MNAWIAIAALLLSACGGGDYTDDEPMDNTQPTREAAR